MSIESDNKKIVEAFFAAMNSGDLQGFVDMYDDGGTCWTSGDTLISGTMTKAQISQGAGAIYEAFPGGIKFTIKALTAEGDRVAVEAESHGEHASGRIYHNLYHFLFQLRDGKVLHLREYMDTELVTDIICGGQRPVYRGRRIHQHDGACDAVQCRRQ